VDHDKASEERSEFWERALASDEEGYVALIKHSKTLWRAGGQQQRARALTALRTAAASHEDKPNAYFWLGQFLYDDRQWEACSTAMQKVYSMDPRFAPTDKGSANTLDYNLATCLLYSGKYEGAITHYKRIITLDSSSIRVEQKLGEALMALGRLDEAIEFLRLATNRGGRYEARFILAVALDRAERLTESRKELIPAIDRDSDLSSLRSADKNYAPAEDEHYYLGLAYAIATKRLPARKTMALYHFRRYLALSPDSPWRKRAEVHRAAIGVPPFAGDLKIQGSATLDTKTLKSALQAIEAPARACIAGSPGLLIRVDLSAVVASDTRAYQVRATTLLAADIDKATQSRQLQCVEEVVRTLPAPKLSGSPGRHASAHFSLLGSP
jgi:tetratricopeptide (TPR) repeat protein